jgi:hypothetical protein
LLPGIIAHALSKAQTRFLSRLEYFPEDFTAIAVRLVQTGLAGLPATGGLNGKALELTHGKDAFVSAGFE